MAARLDGLNGRAAYLPTLAATDHTQRRSLNYEPTVNPVPSGGYAWVVFTSRRLYGNVATLKPYWSDPRYDDLSTHADDQEALGRRDRSQRHSRAPTRATRRSTCPRRSSSPATRAASGWSTRASRTASSARRATSAAAATARTPTAASSAAPSRRRARASTTSARRPATAAASRRGRSASTAAARSRRRRPSSPRPIRPFLAESPKRSTRGHPGAREFWRSGSRRQTLRVVGADE